MINFLPKRFQNKIFHSQLFKKKDKIVIGISGGPDSVSLTRLLNDLKKKYELELLLVHINYGLRNESSTKDEKFVVGLADELDIPLKVYKYKNTEKKGNLEENLREFRYKLFEKERKENSFDYIAIGHTLDDKVETFLMNLIRGAGNEGLVSLEARKNKIIRPLIFFQKKELLEYLNSVNQLYRLDESNLDKKFFRNRIRLELIPLLEKEYNPQIKKRVSDLIEHIRSDLIIVEEINKKTYNELIQESVSGLELDVKKAEKVSLDLLKRIFRTAIINLQGDLRNVSAKHFFEFLKIFNSRKSKEQSLDLERVRLTKKGNKIIFQLKSK